MLTSETLLDIARQMQSAHDQVQSLAPFTATHSGFDLPAAYQVAELVHRIRLDRGALPVGRKIGFTNPQMWDLYGVREPIWAFVYDRTVTQVNTALARCRISGFTEPKIEPELVLHFHAAPAPGADEAATLECIDWIAFGFEIVQSHFPEWKFRAADTVADCSLHAALFVGPHLAVKDLGPEPLAALKHFSLRLHCDGRLQDSGNGTHVLGSPVIAIAHLMSVLSRQPQFPPLQAGELVTTGTITLAQPVKTGQTWGVDIDGIATANFSLLFEA